MKLVNVLSKQFLGSFRPIEFLEKIFFSRFVAGYADLGIYLDSSNTTWTHEMIRFAFELGRVWGFLGKRETKRWDVSWTAEIEDELYRVLRFEHENKYKWESVWKTVNDKLVGCTKKNPSVLMLVGIVYPASEKEQNKLILRTEKLAKSLENPDVSLLLIVDSGIYTRPKKDADCLGNQKLAFLRGHLFNSIGQINTLNAYRGCNLDGLYYAYPWY